MSQSNRPEDYDFDDRPLVYPPEGDHLDIVREFCEAERPGSINMTVFCSNRNVPAPFTESAEEFARLLGERGHNLVWGGSETGLMKTIADAALEGGAVLIGVGFDNDKWPGHRKANVLFGAADLAERKRTMMSLGDIAIGLPGGFGSLDEIVTIWNEKKVGRAYPPVILLNTNGFYDGLRQQVDAYKEHGFLSKEAEASDFVRFADTPEEAVLLAEEAYDEYLEQQRLLAEAMAKALAELEAAGQALDPADRLVTEG